MARFDVSGLDEIIKQMNQLGEDTGEVADEMLLASAEIVKNAWKASAEQAGHRDTGDMINSIGYARRVQNIKDVRTVDVYPRGKDKKGTRNAEKAFVLHYGTSKITGSRFVDVADAKSSKPVEETMARIWTNYLKKRGLAE